MTVDTIAWLLPSQAVIPNSPPSDHWPAPGATHALSADPGTRVEAVGRMPPHMAATILQRAYRRRVLRELAELAELHQLMHGNAGLNGSEAAQLAADVNGVNIDKGDASGEGMRGGDGAVTGIAVGKREGPSRSQVPRALFTVQRSTPSHTPTHPRRPDTSPNYANSPPHSTLSPSPHALPSAVKSASKTRSTPPAVDASLSEGSTAYGTRQRRWWGGAASAEDNPANSAASSRPISEESNRSSSSAAQVEYEPLPLPVPPVPRQRRSRECMHMNVSVLFCWRGFLDLESAEY